MKNGFYSIHIHMLDGVRGRDSGVFVLRNGVLIGGGPYFWSAGSYTVELLDDPPRIGAKVEEEAEEVARAAREESDERVAEEASDVL